MINTFLKLFNSSSSNFSLEQIKIDLWIRFLNVPRFHCMGACEFQFIYKSALVFLSTVASYSLFPVHVISKSRNVIFWFSLISCLNWMLGWWLLNFSKTNLIFEASIYAWVSSTYLFQWVYCFLIFFFFFYQGFISQTLTTHRTAGEGRGPSFIPLYHFHPLTNIQTFICNFACEMTITYF